MRPLVLMVFLLVIPAILSQQLPQNIQKAEEYNRELALSYVKKISFPVAFIAGVFSIFSPCILPLIPAFFTYTFKERQEISRMTFVFFLGFSVVFVLMGIIVGYLGSSLVMFQQNITLFIRAAGLFLILMGVMTILGKGFSSFVKARKKPGHDVAGVFIFGVFFALGWSACLGPILSGILMIAGILQNYVLAGVLLFVYSLGIFLPLFVISFFFDKYKIGESKWFRGKEYAVNVGGLKLHINSVKLVSGMLFILVGLVFVFLGNTAFVNSYDVLKTKMLFYEYQNRVLGGSAYLMIAGIVLMAVLVVVLFRVFIKNREHISVNDRTQIISLHILLQSIYILIPCRLF